MEGGAVNGSKMTLNSANFLFKYRVEESSIEFSDSCWSGCNIHGFLATSKNHLKYTWMIKHLGVDHLTSEGGLGDLV